MKRLIRNLGIAVVAVVLWIFLVEILIRTFFPQAAMFHKLDPTYGYVGIPEKSGWYLNREREYRVRLTMNREGFRDVDHELAKPGGVYRILFLGDSFTEAKEVELEETYWRRLLALMPKTADGRTVEVINMGVSGYSTGTQLLLLKNRALAWKPDLVVLAFTEFTDVWNNHHVLDCLADGRDPSAPIKPYFDPNAETLTVLPFKTHDLDRSVLGVFRRNFQTYMYVRNLAVANPGLMRLAWKLGFVRTPPVADAQASRYPLQFDLFRTDLDTDAHWREAWSITERLLVEIQKTCRGAGADLLVLDIPFEPQVSAAGREAALRRFPAIAGLPMDWERPGKLLMPILRKYGIASLYLYEPLRALAARAPEPPIYFPADSHFTPRGHEVVAELLRMKLQEEKTRVVGVLKGQNST